MMSVTGSDQWLRWWCIAAMAVGGTLQVERTIVDVLPVRRPCMGEGVRACLVVRWAGDTTWGAFYDDIDGFPYEPGVQYRLLVERRPIPNPLADASAYAYRLVRICHQTRGDRVTALAPVEKGVAECP
ncbi:DUF4377 domain-containing protein [Gemmatimonas sp.]